MGYDDKFYYGQGKIKILADGMDGQTVTLTSGNRSYNATVVDNECNLLVAGTNRYDIAVNGSYVKSIDVSYGQCLTVEIGE